MSAENLIGQTLDGKYKIESEIGKGGMGTVYLSTHVGTERPVAVKVIAPQFMQRTEFVERFRREARAAGRLRHPNVVDVTDFGFSETDGGRVAYLVMEYLDGCTLGEILDEEKKLPLRWSLDILEQVCSAVQEAHAQGIIHRDLKPDNIWLEPDGRGGYTVKVLDFGIAKLENHSSDSLQIEDGLNALSPESRQTQLIEDVSTVSDVSQTVTFHEQKKSTIISEGQTRIEDGQPKTLAAEAGTLLQPLAEIDTEGGTAILHNAGTKILEDEIKGTKILATNVNTNDSEIKQTSELTRVGAVLGTPLYMSPEQCRGDKLTASSDIYSLGVIAYQMISGKPPFTGDFTQVMDAHKDSEPPPLEAAKVSVNVKKVIFSALEKYPGDRPQTADAFASSLRSQSEGVWTLMSKAMMVYSENFLKFILLAFIVYLPMEILFLSDSAFSLLGEFGIIQKDFILKTVLSGAFTLSGFFSSAILSGIITWLVAQKMAVPVRPLKLRPAFRAVRRRLKPLLLTSVISIVCLAVGTVCLILPGLFVWIFWSLVTPVVMLENLSWRKTFKRSYQLVRRNLKTTIAVMVLAAALGGLAGGVAVLLSNGIIGNSLNSITVGTVQTDENQTAEAVPTPEEKDFEIKVGQGQGIKINEKPHANETDSEKRSRRVRGMIRESVYAAIQIPLSTLIGSFFAVVIALLYIKTRMAGGESLSDLLEQFEETDQPRKKWQERVRGRLLQSARITGRNT